jgi:3-oxoacyl-[acyl-carrier protein] reductase
MELNLQNKTFIVTGSSKGIGKAIAKAFLKEGANVVLVARNKAQLESTNQELVGFTTGNNLLSFSADCTNELDVIEFRNFVIANCNSIDGLILNVGSGTSTSDPISEKGHWENIWDINFNSAIIPSRIFLNDLVNAEGCILFISSIAGIESIGAPTDYSVAKTALLSLSKNLSKKIAPHVRVNTICPGNIFFEGGTWEKKLNNNSEAVLKSIQDNVPLNRFGTPEEIADAALFLCSPRSSFITGSVLIIDGGQTKSLF